MINQNHLILLFFLARRGYTLGDTGVEGITLGENPARHCFVLWDLL